MGDYSNIGGPDWFWKLLFAFAIVGSISVGYIIYYLIKLAL